MVDSLEHVVVRPRVGLNRGPAAVEENPHRDPATGRCKRGIEKWIRRLTPQFVEIERVDRKSHLRGGEEAEDTLGLERRVRSEDDPCSTWRGRGPGRPWDEDRGRGQRLH